MQLLSTLLYGALATSAIVSARKTHHGHHKEKEITKTKAVKPPSPSIPGKTTPGMTPGKTTPGMTPGKKTPGMTSGKKTCNVKGLGNGADDAPNILAAAKECNHGGTVGLLDPLYTIGTALDLTFLDSVDINIEGRVVFTANIKYWTANSFKYKFQDQSTFWKIGGQKVNIFGKGTLDGNGQAWYDAFATDKLLQRPTLLSLDGLKSGSVKGIKMVQSPSWFNFATDCTDILYSDLTISVKSSSANTAKNTDGFDTYRSDHITIQNSIVNNGDDCVSFKPNSTNIIVQNCQCTGSHGISVGSLGQYPESFDRVENVLVQNITMSEATSGARIKVWPGGATAFQPSLTGGGGSGLVKNIKFINFKNKNNDLAIELTSCYGQKDAAVCAKNPSKVQIEDVMFEDFTGTTSLKNAPIVGSIVCGSQSSCKNISAHKINVTPPSGMKAQFTCTNIDKTSLDIACKA